MTGYIIKQLEKYDLFNMEKTQTVFKEKRTHYFDHHQVFSPFHTPAVPLTYFV